jgi:hypothetical protein
MLRATKITAMVVMPVLFAAWVILFLFPTRTEALWAWTINPRMSAITMGSGYLGGVWFFYRVATAREPHRVAGGLFAAAVFTTLLGVTTIVHWDRFNHDHVSFWAWAFLYFVSPVFLPFLFRANRAASSPRDGDLVPRFGVVWLVIVGVTQIIAAATWFLAPDLAIDNWPWTMTPLTVRSISSFVAFCGTLLLWVLVDRRYSALQAGVEALMIGLLVTSIGALIAHDDFDGPTYGIILYVLALATLLVLFGALLAQVHARRPT